MSSYFRMNWFQGNSMCITEDNRYNCAPTTWRTDRSDTDQARRLNQVGHALLRTLIDWGRTLAQSAKDGQQDTMHIT